MALHRDHIRLGHGAIDEWKVTLAEFAAVHSLGLESTGSVLLEVPDGTKRVPNPKLLRLLVLTPVPVQ
jgi:hypothetical protein